MAASAMPTGHESAPTLRCEIAEIRRAADRDRVAEAPLAHLSRERLLVDARGLGFVQAHLDIAVRGRELAEDDVVDVGVGVAIHVDNDRVLCARHERREEPVKVVAGRVESVFMGPVAAEKRFSALYWARSSQTKGWGSDMVSPSASSFMAGGVGPPVSLAPPQGCRRWQAARARCATSSRWCGVAVSLWVKWSAIAPRTPLAALLARKLCA
jgi:hypothetical protein